MDNIIYIILAAAVFIAMAGILLFIATDSFEGIFEESEELRDDPEDRVDINHNFENKDDEFMHISGKLDKQYNRGILHG